MLERDRRQQELYERTMGPAARDRQVQAAVDARACNCGADKPFQHLPGCPRAREIR